MKIIEVTQALIPRVQFIRAIEDRERNSQLGKFLLSNQLDHLQENHQFRKLKISIMHQSQNSAFHGFITSIRAFGGYIWKIFQVISWTFANKHQEVSKREFAILKGFGFQQVNPFFPPEEIIESLPTNVLQTEKKEEVDFILISQLTESRDSSVSITHDTFQALLRSEKPRIKNLCRFLVQASFLGVIALLEPEIRRLIKEIPSALLLANFESKSKFITLIDTQGSFENLDLMYYVSNKSIELKSIMIHYSEGGMPFSKRQLENGLFVHNYELAPVNSHIVWTKEYADYYNLRGRSNNFLALGPQVFRSGNFTAGGQKSNVLRLAVFDETPSLHDEPHDHLREEAGLKFLDAIQNLWDSYSAEQENGLEIFFKQKRRNLEFHSQAYLMRLEALSVDCVIHLVPWYTNPLELVTNSDSVLTVLGSSPALIGRHFQRPTAYGYFGRLELGRPLVNYDIPVLVNDKQLLEWIRGLAGSNRQCL